jgi:hypothetical protein
MRRGATAQCFRGFDLTDGSVVVLKCMDRLVMTSVRCWCLHVHVLLARGKIQYLNNILMPAWLTRPWHPSCMYMFSLFLCNFLGAVHFGLPFLLCFCLLLLFKVNLCCL